MTSEKAEPAKEAALQAPTAAADKPADPEAGKAVEQVRVDLSALLNGTATPDALFEAAQANALGIEARGQGAYALARALYMRSLEIDNPANFIGNCANLADLDRLEGRMEDAHRQTDRGIAMAHHLASEYGLSLEDPGARHDDPEQGAKIKAFWFAVGKVFNFKALTYRAQFDQSGTGDARNGDFLQKSLLLNQQAFDIASKIGHGYRNKVVVDLLSDQLESGNPDQLSAAIKTAEDYLAQDGLDANRRQNFLTIRGTAQLKLGETDKAINSFMCALEVSETAALKRETANNLVRLLGTLCSLDRAGEISDELWAKLDASISDLAASDIGSQKAMLQAIQPHHALPEQFTS